MKNLFAKRGLIYPLLLIVILIGPFYRGIDNQQFHEDESHWYYFGTRYFSIFFLHKDWKHPVWSKVEAFDQPQIGRYLIGLRLWLHGGESFIRQIIKAPHYSSSHSRTWNHRNGRIPSTKVLRPGRTMMASFGLAGCLLIYCIGHCLIAPEAGLVAALLLGLNPLMLGCSRRAMTDAPLLCFMAMMVVLMLALLYQYRRHKTLAIGAVCVLTGITLGIATGIKLNGGLMGIIFAGWMFLLALEAVGGQPRALALKCICRISVMSLTTALLAFFLFVVLSPNLYRHPLQGCLHMIRHRVEVVKEQQQHQQAALKTLPDKLSRTYKRLFQAPKSYSLLTRQMHLPFDLCFFIIGLTGLLRREIHYYRNEGKFSPGAFILVWVVGLFLGILVWIPLDWPRYYLPLFPPQVVLVSSGIYFFMEWLLRKTWWRPPWRT